MKEQDLKVHGLRLEAATSRVHWIITDFKYGFLPQKERVLRELELLRKTVDEAIQLITP